MVAVAALLCSIATAGRADDGVTVEFHGRHYRVPLQPGQLTDPVYVQRFGDAMEVELPVGFWNSLYHDPAVVTGWQLEGQDMPLRLTLPDDIYFWSPGHPAGQPPVSQVLVSDGVQHGVHVWEDTASHAPFGRLLLSYDARTDFYVVCDRRQIWNQRDSCDLIWNDSGVLAVFSIYGNLVASAPAVLNAFMVATRAAGPVLPRL